MMTSILNSFVPNRDQFFILFVAHKNNKHNE